MYFSVFPTAASATIIITIHYINLEYLAEKEVKWVQTHILHDNFSNGFSWSIYYCHLAEPGIPKNI